MTPIIDAPDVELRLALSLRRYERVKLCLLVVVLCIDIAIGAYLIGLGRGNHESLVILRCAVDRSTQVDNHGNVRTPAESRDAFDRCVQAKK